jgi:hypothetical protein
MKTLLVFNLPDDQLDLELAQNARRYQSALWEINNYRRVLSKFEERAEIPTQEVINKLLELLKDTDI